MTLYSPNRRWPLPLPRRVSTIGLGAGLSLIVSSRRTDSWLTTAGLMIMLPGLANVCFPRVPPPTAAQINSGLQIYRAGVLPSGQPLQALRDGAEPLQGRAAACVNCHQRSGLGSEEGRLIVPPITAKYLFRDSALDAVPSGSSEATEPVRSRYTRTKLARAIREGVDPDGHSLDYLMPRYALDESSMTALISYLRQLSRGAVRGVGDGSVEFATIITPDADPIERQGMLDVLEHFFGAGGSMSRGEVLPLQGAPTSQSRFARKWRLHVWQLTGADGGWEAQLHQHLTVEPVFAVISGLGRRNWSPVHHFCQEQSLPCLFPNVDLPEVAEDDFYPAYLYKGVLLESQIIAAQLRAPLPGSERRRVIQVFRADDIGAAAAAALQQSAAAMGLENSMHPLKAGMQIGDAARLLKTARAEDAIVLWLRPDDLKHLPAMPPKDAAVFVSGLMGGLEQAPLPNAWRAVARLSYPFALPAQRATALTYARGWFAFKQIPIVAERIQTNTYLACAILADASRHMHDDILPDYLLETVQAHLDRQLINGYFLRLGLAPGQRFASKGGYVVHFEASTGTRLAADTQWIVP
jgi:hypothetical protein